MKETLSENKLFEIHIKNIIHTLKEHEEFMEENQEDLREFVLNKSFPLKDRFEVWCKWCKKIRMTNTIALNIDDELKETLIETNLLYE